MKLTNQQYQNQVLKSYQSRVDSLEANPISKKDLTTVINLAFGTIARNLHQGNSVGVASIGKFSVHKRGARKGRNPQTGREIKIAARKVPFFTPSSSLKRVVNDGTGQPLRD